MLQSGIRFVNDLCSFGRQESRYTESSESLEPLPIRSPGRPIGIFVLWNGCARRHVHRKEKEEDHLDRKHP